MVVNIDLTNCEIIKFDSFLPSSDYLVVCAFPNSVFD